VILVIVNKTGQSVFFDHRGPLPTAGRRHRGRRVHPRGSTAQTDVGPSGSACAPTPGRTATCASRRWRAAPGAAEAGYRQGKQIAADVHDYREAAPSADR